MVECRRNRKGVGDLDKMMKMLLAALAVWGVAAARGDCLDELLPRMEGDADAFPIMATVSVIEDNPIFCDAYFGTPCFVEPYIDGPFFTAKEAYERLCVLLRRSIGSIEPGDIDLLAANLVVEYLEEGRPHPSDTFDLASSHWEYAVCFHHLPGLRPGKPVYGVVATMWH